MGTFNHKIRLWILPCTDLLLSRGSPRGHSSADQVPFSHPFWDTELPSQDLRLSSATAWHAPWRQPRGCTLLPLAAAPLHYSGLAPCPAPPQPGRPGRGRGRGSGGVSDTEAVGASGSGARWRRGCCSREEACCGQPPPAASCPGSGEQRRPFRGPAGEGPPWGEGRGVPGAGRGRRGPASESQATEGWRGCSAFPGPLGAQGHRPAGAALAGDARDRGPRPPAASARCAPRSSDASPQVAKRSERMAGSPRGSCTPRSPLGTALKFESGVD